MRCNFCGQEMPERSEVCPHCGKKRASAFQVAPPLGSEDSSAPNPSSKLRKAASFSGNAAPKAAARVNDGRNSAPPPAAQPRVPNSIPAAPTSAQPRAASPAPAAPTPASTPVQPSMPYPVPAAPPIPAAVGRAPKVKAAAPTGTTAKKKKLWPKLTLIGLCVLAAAALTLGALHYFGVIELPFLPKNSGDKPSEGGDSDVEDIPEETLQRPDPEEYLSKRGTILQRTDAMTSSQIRSEAEAWSDFAARGFTDVPINAYYDIGGVYQGETEISENGTARHPYYQTYYQSEYGGLWMITEIDGVFLAEPLSYSESGGWKIPHILSESATITDYDGSTNCFYVIEPDESQIFVKVVSRIDAELLDGLSIVEVDQK